MLNQLAVKKHDKNFDRLPLDHRKSILEKWRDRYVNQISKQDNYTCVKSESHYRLPLTDLFHRYFLCRRYTYPPVVAMNDLTQYMFTLDPHSAHFDDFNHFCNVFASATRLIQYFSDAENVEQLFAYSGPLEEVAAEELRYYFDIEDRKLSFDHDRGRVFRLLAATFYHDVGKTIITHRHALEGAILIAFHTDEFLTCLSEIFIDSADIFVNKVGPVQLDRDDIILIEDFVHYHDLFGTIATGETGYIRLVDVVDCLRRYAQKTTFRPERGGGTRTSIGCATFVEYPLFV